MADKPLGEQYNEMVEGLKAKGVSNADAIRQVAEKFGKKENAIRGGIHQWRARHLDGATGTVQRSRRRAAASVDDLLGNARQAIEQAIALVDSQIAEAKAAVEAAQARYDELSASAEARKAELQAKLEAVTT